MKKIGLVIEGISNLKVFGPILENSGLDKIEAVVFLSKAGGGKDYDILPAEELMRHFPQLKRENVVLAEKRHLEDRVKYSGVETVLLINGYAKYGQPIKAWSQEGLKVYDLDYFVNAIYSAARQDMAGPTKMVLTNLAGRLVTSNIFKTIEYKVLDFKDDHWLRKFRVTGSPAFDFWQGMPSKQAVRQELNLPLEKRIVALFVPNIREYQVRQVYGWWGKSRLKNAITGVKEFCRLHGYYLVIKSRQKQWEMPVYHDMADRFLYDELGHLYPSTSARLLAAADLMVHFGSMGVLEAVAAKIPALGLGTERMDKMHGYMNQRARKIIKDELLIAKEESLFSFADVSITLPITAKPAMIAQTARGLIENRQANQASFDRFAQKYLNGQDETASKKIIDFVTGEN